MLMSHESCRRYNYVSDPQFVNLCIVHQLMNDFMFLLEHIAQCTYRLYIEYFYVVKLSFSRKKEAKEISLMRPPRVFRAIFTDESLFKLLPNIHLHTLYSSKNILISFTIHIQDGARKKKSKLLTHSVMYSKRFSMCEISPSSGINTWLRKRIFLRTGILKSNFYFIHQYVKPLSQLLFEV